MRLPAPRGGALAFALVAILTILTPAGAVTGGSGENSDIAPLGPHPPILIEGDGAFTASNGVTGGNGTPANPYRIVGWDIVRKATPGILVRNTTSHFVLVAVTISGLDQTAPGIMLDNVSNATVRDSRVFGNEAGVHANDSYDVRVENLTSISASVAGVRVSGGARTLVDRSTFHDSGQVGVWAEEAEQVSVIDSDFVMAAERGVMVERASDYRVENSTFTGGRAGVELVGTGGGSIVANRFTDMSGDAVFIRSADNNTITDNIGRNLTIGILAGNSRGNLVRNNTFEECLTAGLSFQQVTASVIDSNRILNTTLRALQLISSPNNTIRNNVIDSAKFGFDLQHSLGDFEAYLQDIEPNNLIDGRPLVYIRDASNPPIPANTSYLALVNVSGANISGLNISRQGQGAVVLDSDNVSIVDSSFGGNADGARILRSEDVTIENITESRPGQIGVTIIEGNRIRLLNSTIHHAASRGMLVKDSSDVEVRGTDFYNNTQNSIQISYSEWFSAVDNRFIQIAETAMEFDSCRFSLVERNYVRGGIAAFIIDASTNTSVLDNDIQNVLGDGIYPRTSNRNVIIGNYLRGIPHPMDLSLSNYNVVMNNTLEDVDIGIFFTFVAASRVENNTMRNITFQGLLLERSPLLKLRNNTVENATYGADIRSDPKLPQSYWMDIDDSNMINGKPLRYISNATSPKIPADTGFLALVNVTGEVSGLDLGNVSEGVLIAHSRDLVLKDSRFHNT
ncbi:MAG TPA: right-handed parallel beta-helix repeat-containing protein, partial [Thermoplasmata archaeon]|nr:right-handed parallel beta-helix repeat-containing protein [Thermoplasmata archaeon]